MSFAITKPCYYTDIAFSSYVFTYRSSYNLTPAIFQVLIGRFFARLRDHRPVTRLENVRQLNIRQDKKLGFQWFIVKPHTSDIRVIDEYIRVTYGWHTSTYEWHTDYIRVTYGWHTSTYEWRTIRYEYIQVTYVWSTSSYDWHTTTYEYIRVTYEWHNSDT